MKTITTVSGITANIGVRENQDGTFTAVTFSRERTFSTRYGAIRWMESIGLSVAVS